MTIDPTLIITLIALLFLILIVLLVVLLMQTNQTRARLNEVSQLIPTPQTFDAISQRIQAVDNSSRQSFERLATSLGELSKATQHMLEVGRTISSIEDLLKPPKLRGGLGETLLEQLLAQILPPQHYRLQYRFKGGEAVDAVILLGDRLVPLDSKFPLDNFRRMVSLDDEAQIQRERRAFFRAIKAHVDAIAQKYILPDEGTYDFALMYIPAENVYYEAVIKDDAGEELFPYATQRHVIPVSPNSLYAYLQVIVYGLKGMHIEEQAKAIMDHLARLQSEENKFRQEFDVLGGHIRNARSKYEDAERNLSRFEDKLLDASTQPEKLPYVEDG